MIQLQTKVKIYLGYKSNTSSTLTYMNSTLKFVKPHISDRKIGLNWKLV